MCTRVRNPANDHLFLKRNPVTNSDGILYAGAILHLYAMAGTASTVMMPSDRKLAIRHPPAAVLYPVVRALLP